MKRIFIFIIVGFTLLSCSTLEDKMRLTAECDNLLTTKHSLQNEIALMQTDLGNMRREKAALQSGREPKYIVKFQIKQGTFTLDIFEHMKNEINSIEIEVPVDKDFYNRLSIGQDITDKFKWGSLVMDGDFSTLHMRVINKRIE